MRKQPYGHSLVLQAERWTHAVVFGLVGLVLLLGFCFMCSTAAWPDDEVSAPEQHDNATGQGNMTRHADGMDDLQRKAFQCQEIAGDALTILRWKAEHDGGGKEELITHIRADADAEDRKQVILVIELAYEYHGGDVIDFALWTYDLCMQNKLHTYTTGRGPR